MRNVLIIVSIVFIAGCSSFSDSIYNFDEALPFSSREYYRTVTERNEIGIASSESIQSEALYKEIKQELLRNGYIKDVIFLSHGEQTVLALSSGAYFQTELADNQEQIKALLSEKGLSAKIVTHPGHVRIAKNLKTHSGNRNEEWIEKWEELIGRQS
ncbi:hypothetical protein [Pseudalkalibacillus caeni]|uniref:Uncharacterized protein n=1 Tax=Exobacillus caeni TaxID=2574798 RepID=A0A5R9FCD8_9BACL|nr:hypothetical protein [Pseudalkalibacillus caeni]TLS39328.1 hypothetical protein FCL54_03215 [Pseudalkalibacillus caeni]